MIGKGGAMKVAVTVWEDTVSTVCDFSSRLLVFDVMGNAVKKREDTHKMAEANKAFAHFKW